LEGNVTTIELTDQQRQALQREHGKPVDVVDPTTQHHYVLLEREQYNRVRSLLEPKEERQTDVVDGIPSGVLHSQQAFWRDLPELVSQKNLRGQWVCYAGDERMGTGPTERALIRECLRRGLRDDEYYTDVIEMRKHAPWEVEEVEPRSWLAQEEAEEQKSPDQP
jgi:hypothetical protein